MRRDGTIGRRNFLVGTGAAGATAVAAGPLGTPAAASTPRRGGPYRVHVVMFDGVEEFDFIAPYEVFGAAGMHSPDGVDLRYVAMGGPRTTVTAAYGTRVPVDHGWSADDADLIVVPGGGYTRREGPGIWAEIDRGDLPAALADAPRRGLTIASVCTGAIVLAAAGLTEGRPCTTHHGAQDELAARGGVLTPGRVVDDGDLVTAGGITAGLELGLWLTRREFGPDAALGVETMLEYEARGTVWTR